jgi:nucleotide-binding universal stress UspA family protein
VNKKNKGALVSERVQKATDSFNPKNVVLATDFLESSRLALDYAIAFSHHFGSTLTIAHAFELPFQAEEAEIVGRGPSVSRKMALSRLEAFASGAARLGIDIKVDLREGDPCDAILRTAVQNRCDLLVLGTHGIYRGVRHLVIGSNAERILLATQCPTLTVGRHVMAGIDLDLRFSDVLVVADTHCDSHAPLGIGLQLGKEFGVPVDLRYVRMESEAASPEAGDRLAGLCHDALENLAIAVEPEWFSAKFHLDRMLSPGDIVRRIESSGSRLIVTGVHRMSRVERHLHASFAFEMAARAASPMLSVPCG